MKFTFTDHVKLATKGFKPNDIAELSALDENKFNKDDIMTLAGSGYNLSDIKKLVGTFDDENSKEQQGDDEGENKEQEKPEDHESDQVTETSSEDAKSVDYKELYEKEKKLREKLQQNNQKRIEGTKDPQDLKSDEEIALSFAEAVLRDIS